MNKIRSLISKRMNSVLPKIPLSTLKKLIRTNLIMPYYHIVSDEEVPHYIHLGTYRNIKKFKDDLNFFLSFYSPISLSDLLDTLKNKRSLKGNSMLLTFDDGLREIYDVIAPVLKEKGIPATFFLSSKFLDNKDLFYRHKASLLIYTLQKMDRSSIIKNLKDIILDNGSNFTNYEKSILEIQYHKKHILDEIARLLNVNFDDYLEKYKPYITSDQVEKLIKDGFTIGSHSIDHPPYSLISLEDQLKQTKDGVSFLKKRFSVDYNAFAFPFSDDGVSKRYFEEIFSSNYVDISFGTSCMMEDMYPNHFQRSCCMEESKRSAETIIHKVYQNKFLRIIEGKDKIVRY